MKKYLIETLNEPVTVAAETPEEALKAYVELGNIDIEELEDEEDEE